MLRILMLVLLLCGPAMAIVPEATARQAAREVIRDAEHLANLPYAARMEKLETEFSEFRVPLKEGNSPSGVFIYEIDVAGCDAHQNCTVVVDGDSRWYVAVSESSGNPYRVSGFNDSTEQFNKLISIENTKINQEHALRFAEFFLKLRFGPADYPKREIVMSHFAIKQMAEREFVDMFGDEKYESLFKSWWNKFTMKFREDLSPSMKNVTEGFEVKLKVLKGMNLQLNFANPKRKSPDLSDYIVVFTPEGLIKSECVKLLFS